MDTGFAELRAANSATLVAASKMQAHIHNQDVVIRSQSGAIQNQNATILILNKKIQDQQKALLEASTQLDGQKAMVKFLAGRTTMLQKKIDFLLADENRACRKVINIQGNAIRVEWTHKRAMDRAVWSLQPKAAEANDENLLEGSTRKKAAKGKPSFYKYVPVAVEVETGLAQMYEGGQVASSAAATASYSSNNGSNSVPTLVASVPLVTARELENVWQECLSELNSGASPGSVAPSAQPLPLAAAMLASVPANPLDHAALQSSSSSSKATSSSAAANAAANSAPGDACGISTGRVAESVSSSSSTVVDLTNGCSIDSPNIRKRPRVQSPERNSDHNRTDHVNVCVAQTGSVVASKRDMATSIGSVSSGSGIGSNPANNLVGAESAVPSNSQFKSTAAAAASKSSSSGSKVKADAAGANTTKAAALYSAQPAVPGNITPLEVGGASQPWHAAGDGPVRQHMFEGMLSRIRGTAEMHQLPTWREARREGCRKLEAQLYYNCPTRGEYLYNSQKA